MNIAVLLSGSGVYDGSEIHESVFTLLALAQKGATTKCFAPDVNQYHVVNHINGEEMEESRNVLIESARIARGDISDVKTLTVSDFDGLVIPGGFGTAKNHTTWAFNGPQSEINTDVQEFIQSFHKAQKPILGLCMGPTTIAKALANVDGIALTVGTDQEASPYDIKGIADGVASLNKQAIMKSVDEVLVDEKHKVVTAPCYMMEASIVQVHDNIQLAVDAFIKLI